MAQDAQALLKTHCAVPELSDTCLSCWGSRGAGIRQLRLVSLGTGMQAVQKCTLQLGDGANPEPHQLAWLLKSPQLKKLKISVLIISGKLAPRLLCGCSNQQEDVCDCRIAATNPPYKACLLVGSMGHSFEGDVLMESPGHCFNSVFQTVWCRKWCSK